MGAKVTSTGEAVPRGSSEWVEVRESGIHQRGLFARKDIPEGTAFIEYVGEKITKAEAVRRGAEQERRGRSRGEGTVYIFNLNSRYDVDGGVAGNDAKYVNHSCDPNTVTDIRGGRIWLIALRDIASGDEITYDYNFDASNYEAYPCRCGSENCSGYMVGAEYRAELRERLSEAAGEREGERDGGCR